MKIKIIIKVIKVGGGILLVCIMIIIQLILQALSEPIRNDGTNANAKFQIGKQLIFSFGFRISFRLCLALDLLSIVHLMILMTKAEADFVGYIVLVGRLILQMQCIQNLMPMGQAFVESYENVIQTLSLDVILREYFPSI